MKFKMTVLIALITASTRIYAAPTMDLGELGISNQTTRSLSFTINNNCSSEIGNVTGYSIKTIPATHIIRSCAGVNTCEIIGYDRPNCTGNAVGGAKINFTRNEMEVISKHIDNIGVFGSIGVYQYNLFFTELTK
jgi:hypothetical protein